MKMEPIVSSETSAIKSQTPGNYPKRNKLREIYLLLLLFLLKHMGSINLLVDYTIVEIDNSSWREVSRSYDTYIVILLYITHG